MLRSIIRPVREQVHHIVRSMANTAGPTLHKFVVYAPDKQDEGTFQKRLSVRAQHFEVANPRIANGMLRFAGAMLSPESVESPTAEKKMVGSVMVFEAEKLEEVKKMVEEDIYYTSGVWDVGRIVILPFQPAPPFLDA